MSALLPLAAAMPSWGEALQGNLRDLAITAATATLGEPIAIIAVSALLAAVVLGLVSGFASVAVYIERKVASFIQCRLGPMEVGPELEIRFAGLTILPKGWYGLGVLIADGLKLVSKEDTIPGHADPVLFRLAPYLCFAATMAAFSVIPAAAFLIPSAIDGGILILLAASSVGIVGLVMGGYASNNKWSLYGAMRSVAQLISYEVPMGLALLSVVLTAGSLDLTAISRAQAGWFWNWYAFQNVWLFLAGIAYFIAAMAETNRTPFDIPEAESELVAGYMTEYSGMRWAIFFLSEYANMLLVSLVTSLFFLGGFHSGIAALDRFPILGPFVLVAKALVLIFLMMWLRWTLPRYRVDRLMAICWKALLPLTLVCFLGAGIAVFQEGAVLKAFWRILIVILIGFFIRAVLAGVRKAPEPVAEQEAGS